MPVEDCLPAGIDVKDTDFGYTLSLIGGKYKIIILYWLAARTVVRHNELKRLIERISFKMLAATLKELEADGLIIRHEYPQIPPKVEYRLSERGLSLLPVLDAMCQWGADNRTVPQ